MFKREIIILAEFGVEGKVSWGQQPSIRLRSIFGWRLQWTLAPLSLLLSHEVDFGIKVHVTKQKMTWVSISSPFLEQEMNRCSPQWAVPTCHSCFALPPPPLTQPFWYQNSQALPVPLHPGVSTAQCDSRYEITGRYLPEIMEVPRPQIGPHWREHYHFQKLPTQGLLHGAVTTKEENPIHKSLWQ